MHVVFNLKWHIVVDNIRYLFDVETSRRNICCYKNRTHPAFFELRENLVSFSLLFVAMNTFDALDILLLQLPHQLVNPFLRFTEDNHSRMTTGGLDLLQ